MRKQLNKKDLKKREENERNERKSNQMKESSHVSFQNGHNFIRDCFVQFGLKCRNLLLNCFVFFPAHEFQL